MIAETGNLLFLLLGLSVGGLGTAMGAGGGFLLSPLFLYLYPNMSPAMITAMSLFAVSVNSTSGSIGYFFRKQIHWPSVFLFSIAAFPGVFIGVKLTTAIPRNIFNNIFGTFLILLSIFLFIRQRKNAVVHPKIHFWNHQTRFLGSFISLFVGVASSLLGIGGGIIHVPLLSEGLNYPIHLAAGTSHAILAITSLVAVINHFQLGDLTPFNFDLVPLSIGLVVGAQIGAHYAKKIKGSIILTFLSAALFSVGLRLLFK